MDRVHPSALILALPWLAALAAASAQEPSPSAAPTMKAIRFHEHGGPEVLRLEDVPRPVPREGEVLVRVHAAGVNPVDWKLRQGGAPGFGPPLPQIPGFDIAGVVSALGPGAERFAVGERVFGYLSLQRGGAYAEYAVALEGELATVPDELAFEEAAGVPLAALTAWQALVETAQLQKGQSVLVHGGAGGVGHFAVQIAKARGARVIATASERNHEFLKGLGAEQVIDYARERFEQRVQGLDVVLDSIGGDTRARSLEVLAPGGFLVSIVGPPSQAELERRGLRGAGILVRPDGAQLAEIAGMIERGELRVEISEVLPLAKAAQAHGLSQGGHTRGKIVLGVLAEDAERAPR